jgi:hypothetical protein
LAIIERGRAITRRDRTAAPVSGEAGEVDHRLAQPRGHHHHPRQELPDADATEPTEDVSHKGTKSAKIR